MKLSILATTHNCEADVTNLVERHVKLLEQFIVIDMGSTDGTIPRLERARERYGEAIHVVTQQTWMRDARSDRSTLATARNYGLRLVRSSWVLVLDDDEDICRGDYSQLNELSRDWTTSGYFLPWHTYGPSGGRVVEDYKLSFFRTGLGIHYEGLFHENPTASVRRLGLRCSLAEVELRHRPKERALKRPRRYVAELTAAVETNPSCARLRWFLGLTHFRLGHFDRAREHLLEASRLDDALHPIEKIAACFLLAGSDRLEQSLGERKFWARTAANLCAEHRRDVEMVAFGRVATEIGALDRALRDAPVEDAFPHHLFYCF